MDISLFLGILFAALSQAAILALVTLGIVLIFRTSYTTNFAQGMIGTLAAWFVTMFHLRYITTNFPNMPYVITVIFAILAGMIFGFIMGLFIDIVLIRKSKFPNPLSKQMITMGIVLLITGIIPTVYSDVFDNPPSPRGFSTNNIILQLSGGNVVLSIHAIITIFISIVVISFVFFMLKYTKWGLGVRATASNEKVASMMGVNTRFITAMSWGIAAAIGSLAATLYAPMILTLSTSMMVFMQVNGFLSAVLGGFGTFYGPIVSAVIIPILNVLLYRIDPIWNRAMVYVVILIVVLFKPYGLFGKKIAKKV